MKKFYILMAVLSLYTISFSQVVNTGQTLKRRQFNLSITPIILVRGEYDLGLNLLFGFGLVRRIDMALDLRLVKNNISFGADIEWGLLSGRPALSLTTGAHIVQKTIGLDGTLNLTFPIRNIASIYGGFDIDLNFRDGADFIWWGFLGTEIIIKQRLSIILEADINIMDTGPHILCVGIGVYF